MNTPSPDPAGDKRALWAAVVIALLLGIRLVIYLARDGLTFTSALLLLLFLVPLSLALSGNFRDYLHKTLRHNRAFLALGVIVFCAAAGFYYTPLYYLAISGLVLLAGAFAYDLYRLYRYHKHIRVRRFTPKVFSLGDEMHVRLEVANQGPLPVNLEIIDELPFELQVRDQRNFLRLAGGDRKSFTYPVRPLSRGVYRFGKINVFLSTSWRLAEWRLVRGEEASVPVYPSVLQMQQFALQANTTVPAAGRLRLRRLAKSYEFDQIKEYVTGDDFRSINWKATGRRNALMVNQYEDERAQRIYCCIDRGRTMLMPFAGLSLLDYAINATLALSNVILKRQDRAGLLTFSNKIGTVLAADSKPDQLRRIMEALYRQEERQQESDYDLLYYASRKLIGGRSLLVLFTNFESNYALDRVLPGLRRISKAHQLVVVLFKNTEIADLLEEKTEDIEDVYRKSTARRFLQQRDLMAARLRQNGIHVVLTRPEDLTGEVINEYLELKRRGVV